MSTSKKNPDKRDLKAEWAEITELQLAGILGHYNHDLIIDKGSLKPIGSGYPILVKMESYESLAHLGKIEPLHEALPDGSMQFGLVREVRTPVELQSAYGTAEAKVGPRGGLENALYSRAGVTVAFNHWASDPRGLIKSFYIPVENGWVFCVAAPVLLPLVLTESEFEALKPKTLPSFRVYTAFRDGNQQFSLFDIDARKKVDLLKSRWEDVILVPKAVVVKNLHSAMFGSDDRRMLELQLSAISKYE